MLKSRIGRLVFVIGIALSLALYLELIKFLVDKYPSTFTVSDNYFVNLLITAVTVPTLIALVVSGSLLIVSLPLSVVFWIFFGGEKKD